MPQAIKVQRIFIAIWIWYGHNVPINRTKDFFFRISVCELFIYLFIYLWQFVIFKNRIKVMWFHQQIKCDSDKWTNGQLFTFRIIVFNQLFDNPRGSCWCNPFATMHTSFNENAWSMDFFLASCLHRRPNEFLWVFLRTHFGVWFQFNWFKWNLYKRGEIIIFIHLCISFQFYLQYHEWSTLKWTSNMDYIHYIRVCHL